MGTRQSTLSRKDVADESSRKKKLEKRSRCSLIVLGTLWRHHACPVTRCSRHTRGTKSDKKCRHSSDVENALLVRLPSDVMSRMLSFLTANEVNESLRATCQAMRQACDSPQYWRELCVRHGKLLTTDEATNTSKSCTSLTVGKDTSTCYKTLYYRNPCVPVDFETISEALTRVARGGTVTLMPGIYNEPLEISGPMDATIRAVNVDLGAALVRNVALRGDNNGLGGPVVAVSNGAKVTLSHLQVLHSAMTHDIISSNVAILARGSGTELQLDSCAIQSDTGRGIVVFRDASLSMKSTTVHDCAATGLWTHATTSVNISKCNFIRNGNFSSNERHGGIFAIAGEIHVKDSLIASNALTGLSAVNTSVAYVSGCDIVANGDEPLTTFDPNSAGREHGIPGVIFEGPEPNNQTWCPEEWPSFGAPTRDTPFELVLNHGVMVESLEQKFRV